MMKKHFKAIAQILREVGSIPNNTRTARLIACEMANYFKAESPNFDRERFLEACGF